MIRGRLNLSLIRRADKPLQEIHGIHHQHGHRIAEINLGILRVGPQVSNIGEIGGNTLFDNFAVVGKRLVLIIAYGLLDFLVAELDEIRRESGLQGLQIGGQLDALQGLCIFLPGMLEVFLIMFILFFSRLPSDIHHQEGQIHQ